ncbi:DUF6993 domain-containing protein [Pseudarthrobacter sp. TAF60_1]|uniref:DUF6993 domain-containing protein n=1 Tax=Pseudarthrobacter sp. TAF60_1 TaxID=3233071 RepID=UPI003F94A446
MKRATENRQATPVTSRPALTRQRTTAMGRALALLTAGGLTAFALTGCTGGSSAGTQPAASPLAVEPTVSGTTAAPEPGSSKQGTAGAPGATTTENPATAAMKQTVTDALSRLAAGTPKPATAQVKEALTGAGVAPAALEVSASRTPTGLEADAIESAVLQGKDCVLGHIRDGSVSVTILPVLASGKCFVGPAA